MTLRTFRPSLLVPQTVALVPNGISIANFSRCLILLEARILSERAVVNRALSLGPSASIPCATVASLTRLTSLLFVWALQARPPSRPSPSLELRAKAMAVARLRLRPHPSIAFGLDGRPPAHWRGPSPVACATDYPRKGKTNENRHLSESDRQDYCRSGARRTHLAQTMEQRKP